MNPMFEFWRKPSPHLFRNGHGLVHTTMHWKEVPGWPRLILRHHLHFYAHNVVQAAFSLPDRICCKRAADVAPVPNIAYTSNKANLFATRSHVSYKLVTACQFDLMT
eukprot:1158335-Pelagomonas_calceolata.AAC.18